jgi:hypothetical protein
MKKFVIGVVALVLTVALGTGATYVFNRVYIRFENVAVGSIAMPPDGRGGFSSFKASDGVNLYFDHLEFPSAVAAREAFQKVLGQSTKIIEREELRDREGKAIIGERVVGMFPSDDGREWPMVVCVDGHKLYEISSTSLRHIALFEKEHRRF